MIMLCGAAFGAGYYCRLVWRQENGQLRQTVSRVTRDLNLPYENGYATRIHELRRSDARFGAKNNTNRGAELLYATLGHFPWSSDTDADGILEASDRCGNPLVLLDREEDIDMIESSSGERVRVNAAPWLNGGFYVAPLDSYMWLDQDSYTMILKGLESNKLGTKQ